MIQRPEFQSSGLACTLDAVTMLILYGTTRVITLKLIVGQLPSSEIMSLACLNNFKSEELIS